MRELWSLQRHQHTHLLAENSMDNEVLSSLSRTGFIKRFGCFGGFLVVSPYHLHNIYGDTRDGYVMCKVHRL